MYKRRGSPYWWIAYRDASGRKIERSTETADRAKAALIEAEARAAVWNAKHRPAPAAPVVANPLFDEILADYLESAQLRREITRDIYAGRILAQTFAGQPIRAIAAADIRRYQDDRRRAGVADATIKRELNVFCAALNWARDANGLDIPNPVAHHKPPAPPGRVRWLTHEAATTLLNRARANQRAPWLADFIELALMTGMRKGELLNLDWNRVDLKQRLIYFTAPDQQKNRQLGSIPLNERARNALLGRANFRAGHCPASPWVFGDRQGQRIQRIDRSFRSACRAAGITDFHIHDLRHTCAAWLVQAGAPLLDVSYLLRHRSIEITQRYAHLAPHQARAAVERLEALDDNPATIKRSPELPTAISA